MDSKMKLTRRSFLGLLSAIPFTPLIAKDLGDFEFLPSEVATNLTQTITESSLPVAGQLRYNINSNLYEVYDGKQWNIITMESKQNG